MLQPRVSQSQRTNRTRGLAAVAWSVTALLLLTFTFTSAQDNIDSARISKDLKDGEITTLVLVQNNHPKPGRFFTVTPKLGLISTTERTFIENNVVTKYKSEIVGTTLQNGRLYAQILTKNSQILYDIPIPNTKVYGYQGGYSATSNNDRNAYRVDGVVNYSPGFDEYKADDFDDDSYVIKNPDYIEPSTVDVHPIFQPSTREGYLNNQYLQYYLESESDEESNPEESPKEVSSGKAIVDAVKINVQTVKPSQNLPTYTIKNDFQPEYYYIDSAKSKNKDELSARAPKRVNINKILDVELKTTTIFGFADFTTKIGDTVIVFTPSSAVGKSNYNLITPTRSFKSTVENVKATRITQQAVLEEPILQVVEEKVETLTDFFILPSKTVDKQENLASKSAIAVNIAVAPKVEDNIVKIKSSQDYMSRYDVTINNRGGIKTEEFSLDLIQPSEVSYSTIHRAHATESLQNENLQQQHTVVLNGDLLLSAINKISVPLNTPEVLTEKYEESYTTGQDEITTDDNITTENSYTITTENDEVTPQDTTEYPVTDATLEKEELPTVSNESDAHTTDKSTNNDESQQNIIEPTDKDVNNSCYGNIVPSTVKYTSYKTLTYLTSYFIPLEGSITSTSVKSDVVTSTSIGYSTKCPKAVEDSTKTIKLIDNNTLEKVKNNVINNNPHIKANKQKNVLAVQISDVTDKNIKISSNKPLGNNSILKIGISNNKNEMITEVTTKTTELENIINETTVSIPVTEAITTRNKQLIEEISKQLTTTTEAKPKGKTEEIQLENEDYKINKKTNNSISVQSNEISKYDDSGISEEINANKSKLLEEQVVQDNEIYTDLIYKTLYTTYTYYTTYFDGPSSRISSSKAVVSNVVTSTIDPQNIDHDLMNRFRSTEVFNDQSSMTSRVNAEQIGQLIELVNNKNILESVQTNIETPMLKNEIKEINLIENELVDANAGLRSSHINIKEIRPGKLKTIFTTYTYYTTLFVGDNANLCSRTEVYTNYLDSTGLRPGTAESVNQHKQFDFKNCKTVTKDDITPVNKNIEVKATKKVEENNKLDVSFENISKDYMFSANTAEIDLNHDYSVNAEISAGETTLKKVDNDVLDNNQGGILDDQIISESNVEEITPGQTKIILEASEIPARYLPTYILQTSYTTFTYFTTVYKDDGDSSVRSRLETVTNTVTETLTPQEAIRKEEAKMDKITYFTTFTYWTTLFKDKMTVITSRESVISNVINPGSNYQSDLEVINSKPLNEEDLKETQLVAISPSKTEQTTDDKESTNINLEVLSIEDKPDSLNSILNDTTNYDNRYKIQDLEGSINQKTFTGIEVDLKNPKEEQPIENLTFYTTYTYFTTFYIGNSSELRSSLETVTNIVENSKIEEGDNNLARKIQKNDNKNLISDIKPTKLEKLPEVEKTASPIVKIDKNRPILTQVAVISGDSVIVDERTTEVIETTPKENIEEKEDSTENATPASYLDESESDDEQNTTKRSRLTFTTKKRTFTPVIRPFASRNRPIFSPKLKLSQTTASTAQTITRTDFTPTITATPALKVSKSRFSRTKAINASPNSKNSQNPSGPRSSTSNSPSVKPTRGFSRSSVSGNRNIPVSTRNVIKPSASGRYRNFKAPVSSVSVPQPTEIQLKPESKEEDDTDSTTNNPTTLVGFRPRSRPTQNRPPFSQSRSSNTPRPKNNPGSRTSSTTPKPKITTGNARFAPRQRPGALFPRRNLITTSTDNPEVIEESEPENDFSDESSQDGDYANEESEIDEVITTSTQKLNTPINPVIRPFSGFRRRSKRSVYSNIRSKRQIDYGSRRSQFRRPSSTIKPLEPKLDYDDIINVTSPKPRTPGRFKPRTPNLPSTTNTNQKIVTPTSRNNATSSPKQPFIIRGQVSKVPSSTPRIVSRPRTARPSSRTSPHSHTHSHTHSHSHSHSRNGSTHNSRIKSPKSYNSHSDNTKSTSTSRSRPRTSTRRGNSRHNTKPKTNDYFDDQYKFIGNQLDNDGIITVTHKIPQVITVPAQGGQDQKYLTTLKYSTEVLHTDQYTSTIDGGKTVLILNSESEIVLDNGNKVHIQYILNEYPTTSVTFTPTVIRGRKTSFSHIIPSTIYEVEPISSTIVNQDLNPAVPLANILLSQLLLGQGSLNNGGLFGQNPALLGQALQNQPMFAQNQGYFGQNQGMVTTEVLTDYKVRTTTYVTTLEDKKKTVLTITLRGKELLTTIYDGSSEVITATELITDTVLNTNTRYVPYYQPQQFDQNRLSLNPNQLQQQQQLIQQLLLSQGQGQGNDLAQVLANSISETPKNEITDNDEDIVTDERTSSVITLYVSGKRPGEFSTVLSTVYDNHELKKRYADFKIDSVDRVPLEVTNMPQFAELMESSLYDGYDAGSSKVGETQSLESFFGQLDSDFHLT